MKTLVIAPQPFFTPRGTPFSVYHRTVAQVELGCHVDLLTYGEGDDVAIPGVRIVRIPRVPWLGPIPIGPSRAKLLLDGLLLLWALGLLLRHRYDVVHAHEEAVFFCLPLRFLFRFKLVYDMHSSLPLQLTHFSFTRSRRLIGLFEWLERRALRRADAVIVISHELVAIASSQMPDPSRLALIENSVIDPVRLAESKPAAQAPTTLPTPDAPRAIADRESRALVVYAGTLEAYQGIELLLHSFRVVHEEREDARLVVIGGRADQVDHYAGLAASLGLAPCCEFTGNVPSAVAEAWSGYADVLVSPRTEGPTTPLKIYAMLASGTPIVATRVPSHTQVLDESVAFLAKPEPEALAKGILRALNDEEEAAQRADAACELYAKRYSREVYLAKLRGVLEKLR